MLEKKFLKTLVCPQCKTILTYDGIRQVLICKLDNIVYLIENNIPRMVN